jgi:hypothetical protein
MNSMGRAKWLSYIAVGVVVASLASLRPGIPLADELHLMLILAIPGIIVGAMTAIFVGKIGLVPVEALGMTAFGALLCGVSYQFVALGYLFWTGRFDSTDTVTFKDQIIGLAVCISLTTIIGLLPIILESLFGPSTRNKADGTQDLQIPLPPTSALDR